MNSRNILLSHALKEKAALTGLLLILLNFSGSLIAQSYCPANGSACDNHISNVALPSPLGGINRNSGCETGNYVDVTSFIVTMAVNTTYNGTISSNQGGYVCATVGIWVDWNNNFLFTDVGENVFLSGSWTGGNPLPISVTPPNGTTAGYKRMRIRSGSNCTGTMGPCGAFGTGEVEDYTVNVVTCTPAPGNPSAIAGAASVCSGSNQTYSVSAAANATGYTWTVPAGATFTGQNTTSVSVTFGSSSGTISVTSNNACGTSAPSTLAVTVNPLPVVNITPASATICSGSSQTLTASGATTYAWTPSSDLSSSSGATVTASPTITSTYTVTGTSSGCSGTQTVTVTVDAAPSPPTAASNSPVCTGNSLNLSAGTVAGATYSWTGPNGFTSTDQNPSIPNVTNAEVGTYSVSVMVNGCSSADATTTVIVDPPPAAPVASSNSPLCAGTTLNLTTDPVAGATYAWSGPNNFSSALQNPSISFVTPAESGTYSVTISVNGCTSLPGTVTVTVNAGSTPAITVNGPATFCAGDSVELIASAGNSYLWSNGLTSQAIWVSTTDSYSVAVDDGSGCPGISLPETITVNSLPSVSFTGLNSGYCLSNPPATLSGNPANGIFTGGGISGNMFDPAVAGLGTHTVNYNYTDPNGCSGSYSESTIVSGNAYLNLGADTIVCDDAPVFTINAGTFSSYTWHDNSSAATYSVDAVALGVGFYTMYVNVTDANGCNGTDTIVVEVSDCTGLTEFSGMQISIAPNPSTGIFQISLSGLSSDNIRLTLTNVAGQTVMMKNVSLTSGLYKDQLDLTMLPGGIYFLQVSDGTQSGVYKIVLE